jgi:hypothetical protein
MGLSHGVIVAEVLGSLLAMNIVVVRYVWTEYQPKLLSG